MEETHLKLPSEKISTWLDRPLVSLIKLNAETLVIALIIILAIASRFYILENRVMSHDENSHVYYSWRFYKGQGFAHDPLMHGPFQFHVVALTYFMFGDNDFTARIPAALFSIATVLFTWNYRRYLGRAGALAAAAMMLISPYILFYGRYVRNEAFVGLFGVIGLWAMLRYFETGQARYMYWLTAATVLHFTAKETAFIYSAQMLMFLALYLIYRLSVIGWISPSKRINFLLSLLIALIFLSGAAGVILVNRSAANNINATALPAPDQGPLPPSTPLVPPSVTIILVACAALALLAAAYFAIQGHTLKRLRRERSFDLLMLLGTLVLPQLSAFPVSLVGWNVPTNASEVMALSTADIWHIAVFLVPSFLISAVIGLWWNRREWLINAGIFYAIFIVFYTSVFTNGAGFFTGIVGSLGYWLKQQGVNRGSQPWYYYALVQVPMYEYLPLLGCFLAAGIVLFKWLKKDSGEQAGLDCPLEVGPQDGEKAPVVALLGFWSVTSLVAFSLAGEKMPWLTVHITLGMILLAGWAIGCLIESVDWGLFRDLRGWLIVILIPVFLVSFTAMLASLLGANTPFQGKTLEQLQATSDFLLGFVSALASGVGLFFLIKPWPAGQFSRAVLVFILAFAAALTVHTTVLANYINYDNANELLVYAHGAPGVKQALKQIEEISLHTTSGLAIQVAYDNETSYPYLWYFRNYSNARFYGADPTRSLRDQTAILVGDANYGKIEPVVGQGYYKFDYIRLWWPNQDYWGLTWERLLDVLTDPEMRAAVFQVWLNHDYTKLGQVTNRDLSLPNWSPSARMRLYIRKDVAAQIWRYGVAPAAEEIVADPYEGKQISLPADRVVGGSGVQADTQAGQFLRPRGVAVAPDGTIYVADTGNHRIQHLDAQGNLLKTWGTFANSAAGQAPGGTFNEPWGIAVGLDGSVYVADTWNHRVQKFTADGEFVTMWGYFGQAEEPEAFWGPRGLAVDTEGRLYVTDTGNKRVAVFAADGRFLTQFGSAGLSAGQFDEPVGIAVDAQGYVYVADTWNQRIQVFAQGEDGKFVPTNSWEVAAWYGQSLDNKPFLAVDNQGHLYASDPEGYRVLEFKTNGEFVQFWGDYGVGPDGFGIVGAPAADKSGSVWVTDAGNNRLMRFHPPSK